MNAVLKVIFKSLEINTWADLANNRLLVRCGSKLYLLRTTMPKLKSAWPATDLIFSF